MKSDNYMNKGPELVNYAGPEWLSVVRQHVESLRFGTVQITIHDSKVVQIEKSEKVRFPTGNPDSKGIRSTPRNSLPPAMD